MPNDARETLIHFGHRPGVLHTAVFGVLVRPENVSTPYPVEHQTSWVARVRNWIGEARKRR